MMQRTYIQIRFSTNLSFPPPSDHAIAFDKKGFSTRAEDAKTAWYLVGRLYAQEIPLCA
jgi:hypothetical protein